jgi:hypothetical protein
MAVDRLPGAPPWRRAVERQRAGKFSKIAESYDEMRMLLKQL